MGFQFQWTAIRSLRGIHELIWWLIPVYLKSMLSLISAGSQWLTRVQIQHSTASQKGSSLFRTGLWKFSLRMGLFNGRLLPLLWGIESCNKKKSLFSHRGHYRLWSLQGIYPSALDNNSESQNWFGELLLTSLLVTVFILTLESGMHQLLSSMSCSMQSPGILENHSMGGNLPPSFLQLRYIYQIVAGPCDVRHYAFFPGLAPHSI